MAQAQTVEPKAQRAFQIRAVDLRAGWETLGEISGKTAGEHIIDEIFSKFCVGK